MPPGQSVKGMHTALEPTPAASLAPTAVYTIFAPAAGGPLGAVGLSVFENLLQLATARPRANTTIRKIGERWLT
jgi:hypothetical protein